MSLPNLLYFYRRRLRARLVQELLALVGIAVGVALLFAVQVSNSSLRASITDYSDGLLGRSDLQAIARSADGFDANLVDAIRRIDGVAGAGAVVDGSANLVGPDGERQVTIIAADRGLVDLGGRLLRTFGSDRLLQTPALVLPEATARDIGAAPGSEVALEVRGELHLAPVGTVVDRDDIGRLDEAPVALTPLRHGQEVLGLEGRVRRIYVESEPGARPAVEAAMRRVGGAAFDVRPADWEHRLFDQAAVPVDRSTAAFAGISALVGFMFAFNALFLLARDRRALIAELRLSGYRMRTVMQILAFDALIVGAAGCVVGLALGDLLSRTLIDPSPGYLAAAFPVGSARAVDLQSAAYAVAGGLTAAQLATFLPLVSAVRNGPIDALDGTERGAGPRRRRSALHNGVSSAALATLGTVLAIVEPELAVVAAALLLVAMLVVLPVALTASTAIVGAVRRRRGGIVATVCYGELRGARARSLALTAIAAVAVFGSTAIEGAHSDLLRGLDRTASELVPGDGVWLTASGSASYMGTTPLAGDALVDLERHEAVRAVHLHGGGFVELVGRRAWVLAPEATAAAPLPVDQVVEGDADAATDRIRDGGWIAVSSDIANAMRLEVGDQFSLPAPRPIGVRLAAITNNLGWPGGGVVMNARDFRRAWPGLGPAVVRIEMSQRSGERAAEALAAVLGPDARAFTIETTADRVATFRERARDGLARLTQIAVLVLLAAGLAVAAALGGMLWQRRRQIASLKLTGVDHRRLWGATLLESAVLVMTGCGLGAVFGVCGQQLLDRALIVVTGFPLDPSLGVGAAATSLATVATISVMIAALPGYFAARVPAVAAFAE